MAKRMKTTLLIFATMLLVGSADAAGAKKRAQDNTERNPAVSAKEGDGVKNGARDKGPVVAIKKFVPAPGAVAEFELAYDECPTNAIELYQSKAESGDSKAQYFVAKALLFGIGCGKDENTAVKWAAKSADSGFAPAISLLGCCYQSGCGIEKDCLMAAELFEKSSSMGSLSGKYNIGLCYVKGDGVEKNEGKGMKLIEEAAVAGFPAAMVEMGQGCRRKFNVTKDYEFRKKARNWFRKAMEAGNEEGKWRFVMTWGVTDRWEESPTVEDHEILRNACLAVADDGLTSYQKYLKGDMRAYACFTIGNMAETGWGQEKDLILALEWYEKAARLSSSYDSDLRRLREELEKKI